MLVVAPFSSLGMALPLRPLLSVYTLSQFLRCSGSESTRTHILQAPGSTHCFTETFGNAGKLLLLSTVLKIRIIFLFVSTAIWLQ